jgi:crossover junction endodeoxyribonuclease RusA
MVLILELPWPPSINHYWRHTKNGHYISNEGQEYRQLVLFRCLKYRDLFTKADRFSIHIDAFPPDKRKRDLDNILKSLLDALQHGGLYPDDSQIDRLSIERNSALNGIVRVTLTKIQNGIRRDALGNPLFD